VVVVEGPNSNTHSEHHRLVHIYSRYRTSYSRRMESCRHW